MTTTTTLLAGGLLGPSIAAAALAGALGLGLAAHVLRGRGGRDNDNRYKHNGGYDSYSHSGYHDSGYQDSGYGHHGKRRRRRREIKSQSDDERLSQLLEVIRREDVTECGLRLVCDLASVPIEELTEDEIAILELIG